MFQRPVRHRLPVHQRRHGHQVRCQVHQHEAEERAEERGERGGDYEHPAREQDPPEAHQTDGRIRHEDGDVPHTGDVSWYYY